MNDPKAIPDDASLEPDPELDTELSDGTVEFDPVTGTMRIVGRGLNPIEGQCEMPILTADDVRNALERGRRCDLRHDRGDDASAETQRVELRTAW